MRIIKKYQGSGRIEIDNTIPQDNTQVVLRGLHRINNDKFRQQQIERYNTQKAQDDYISNRIQDTRDSAFQVMLNRKAAVPVARVKVTKESQIRDCQESIDYYRDEIQNLQKKDMSEEDSTYLELYNEELAKLYETMANLQAIKSPYIIKELGPTCIMTYTDSYGHDRAIPGNRTWLSRGKSGKPVYEEKGFVLLPRGTKDLIPGDMIQSIDSEIGPIHSVMYREPSDSEPFIRAVYSNGHVGENSMIKNGSYRYDPEMDNVFRFVGNAKDSARWIKEFKNIKDHINSTYENH